MTTDKKKEEELQPRTVASGYTPLDVSGNDYASMVGMSDVDKAAIEAALTFAVAVLMAASDCFLKSKKE